MHATSHLYSVWVQTKVVLYLVEQLLLQAGQGHGCWASTCCKAVHGQALPGARGLRM